MALQSDHAAHPPFYTGRSAFLKANPFLASSLVHAAAHCDIESTEDIYDIHGMKLWAGRRPLGPELMARLADRELRKPVELCVTARDPVSMLAMANSLDALCEQTPDLSQLLAPHRGELLAALHELAFDPQELLLLSVLRHGAADQLTHALAVAAVAWVAGCWLHLEPEALRPVLRAGLLHDVGLLYLPGMPAESRAATLERRHPLLGAQALRELTRSGAFVAELVAQSHERLNGQGFPRGLGGRALSLQAQALGFAEAVTTHLCQLGIGTHRAAVCCRLVSGEFAPQLVSGVVALARVPAIGPGTQVPVLAPGLVGCGLRRLHNALSRAQVLLSMSFAEEPAVRLVAAGWLDRLKPLTRALRYSGVEDILAAGREVTPASPQEHVELAALQEEIEQRAMDIAATVAAEVAAGGPLAASGLARETLRLLHSAGPETAPPEPG